MKPIEIGQLATEEVGKKDAIHVPVVAVVAGETLTPGEQVTINRVKGVPTAYSALGDRTVGIVDPFLKHSVTIYDIFWLFLQPGSVQDLRHEWDTVEFPEVEARKFEEPFDGDSCGGCY